MKRRIHSLFIVLAAAIIVFACGVFINAETVKVSEGVTGGYIYFDTETGTITDCDPEVTAVDIPSEINGVEVTAIGEDAFLDCRMLTSITIPNSVIDIGEAAFYYCTSLTNITMPNNVMSMGSSTFRFCYSLTSISIPNGVTHIGGDSFEDCESLTSVTIPNSVTSIGSSSFSGCESLTSITIPNSVTRIYNYAFLGCKSLTSITIPNSVTNIGDGAFKGCGSLTSIIVEKENKVYDSRDNCNAIIETQSNTLIAGCSNTIIPSGVRSIGSFAFSGCTSLTSITIPNSVTNIGYWAFAACTSLANITIPNSVKYIGNSAFEFCESLTSITIPNSVTSINYETFWHCVSLTSITIPNSVTSIGNEAFMDCTSLTSITIPNSVTSIGDEAFRACAGLTSIIIPNSVTTIGGGAFYGCNGLTSITISNSVTSIGKEAFFNCTRLTSITIPNSVTSIDNEAFLNCIRLTSITIPNSVTSIGKEAFRSCTSLTSITIPNSVTSIGDKAFYNCTSLTIHGYTGSYAETYAKDNSIPFKSIEETPDDPDNPSSGTIDGITYLAMSDVVYSDKLMQYMGRGPLGSITGAIENLLTDVGSPDAETNNQISQKRIDTWRGIYNQCLLDWEVASCRDNGSGMFASVFYNRLTDQYVMAFRGSQDLFSFPGAQDWLVDDLQMQLMNKATQQMSDALEYAEYWVNRHGDKLTVTGHSLGGGLALLVGEAYNLKGMPFDAAPTTDVSYYYLWNKMGKNYQGIDRWALSDHSNQYCPVGALEDSFKNYVKHKGAGNTNYYLVDTHNRESIIAYKNGRYTLTETVSSLIRTNALKHPLGDDYLQNGLSIMATMNPLFPLLSIANLPMQISSFGRTLFMGTSKTDVINGENGTLGYDVMYGGLGNDRIYGLLGCDTLIGGKGNDELDGGLGNDTYVVFKNHGVDTIYDIEGNDTLFLMGFDSSDSITIDSVSDNTKVLIKNNGNTIVKISKNRSGLLINSFVVSVLDESNNELKSVKIQDWNQWNIASSYRIACPVNVEIYNPNGNKVLTMTDDMTEPAYTDYGNFYVLKNEETGEFEKYFNLVEGYTFKIVGTGEGKMEVSEIKTLDDGTNVVNSITDIPVTLGETFTVTNTTVTSSTGKTYSIEKDKYTVTFNSKGGSNVESQVVTTGEKATKPTDPTKNGYTFKGWFMETECVNEFDFDTAITKDITLYAKWESKGDDKPTPPVGPGGGGGSSGSITKECEHELDVTIDNGIKTSVCKKCGYTETEELKVDVPAVKIASVKALRKGLNVKWSKKNVSGYQVQYSTSAKMKNAKKITVKSKKTTSKKIKKLKSNKKYYVRVRGYIKKYGKTYYSNWSKVKTKKTR